jgi:predicted ribosomally synthesized peptide with nif11-like leader
MISLLIPKRRVIVPSNLQQFLDLLKLNQELQEQVQKVMLSADSTDAALSALAAIASAKGIQLSEEDLKADLPAIAIPSLSDELTDSELKAVTGGYVNWMKGCRGSGTVYCYAYALLH